MPGRQPSDAGGSIPAGDRRAPFKGSTDWRLLVWGRCLSSFLSLVGAPFFSERLWTSTRCGARS